MMGMLLLYEHRDKRLHLFLLIKYLASLRSCKMNNNERDFDPNSNSFFNYDKINNVERIETSLHRETLYEMAQKIRHIT